MTPVKEIQLSTRRCLICQKECDVSEFGAHVFGDHSPEEIEADWPGGLGGFMRYATDSVQKSMDEIREWMEANGEDDPVLQTRLKFLGHIHRLMEAMAVTVEKGPVK